MIKNYLDNQPLVNILVDKYLKTGKNVQAYMFVGENQKILEDVTSLFTKVLVCPNKYEENCLSCNICKRLNDGSYPELKVINPVNNIIKKEDILNIRSSLRTKPVEGKNLIYIINGAELMGKSAANTILKFLEEPEDNIVAIFTTTNLENVLETIISRCQVIKLNNNPIDLDFMDFIKQYSGLTQAEIDEVMNFVINLEKKSNSDIIDSQKSLLNLVNSKEKLIGMLKTMLLLYWNCINGIVKNKNDIYLLNYIDNNDISTLSKKISIVLELLKRAEFNVNIPLMLDCIILRIGEVINGKSCRS